MSQMVFWMTGLSMLFLDVSNICQAVSSISGGCASFAEVTTFGALDLKGFRCSCSTYQPFDERCPRSQAVVHLFQR
ncbi:hypothetical protein JOM56_009353 [Amanita muscaria]